MVQQQLESQFAEYDSAHKRSVNASKRINNSLTAALNFQQSGNQ